MKNILFVLATLTSLSLVACGDKEEADSSATTSSESESESESPAE